MAVAYQTSSSTAAATTNPRTVSTLSDWVPAGVVLFIVQQGSATDDVTAVTYGGVAMSRVTNGFAADSAGEAGAVYAYFLGSGVPQGAQVGSVTHGGTSKVLLALSITAATDTEVVASNLLQGDQANPQIALDSGATESLRFCSIFSGLANVTDLTLVAGTSSINSNDYGQQVTRTIRQSASSTGSFTIGFTSSSDDVAMVAVAVAEVSGGGGATHIPELVMAPYRPA